MFSYLGEPEATAFRIAHTEEMILIFRGYCVQMPQHQEYYESVIQHLEIILQGYEALLEKPSVTH